MVPVNVIVTVTDAVDPSPSCSITSVSGGSVGDSVITGQFSVSVRANNGAAYALTVTCMNSSGNTASAAAIVTVTKTNGNGNGGGPKGGPKQ
jgi:hypothetical protein